MFDTIEEIDAELEKIRRRKVEAQEMIDLDTWGGLLSGSTKKAAVLQRERELLAKREQLVSMGSTFNYSKRIDAVIAALDYLEDALKKEYPTQYDTCKNIEKELEKMREDLDF